MTSPTVGFTSWLKAQKYTTNTIRSYLADITKLLDYIDSNKTPTSSSNPAHLFTVNLLRTYLSSIYGQNNYNHQLASLRLFCQYCQDQLLVSADIFNQATRQPSHSGNSENTSLDNLLAEFNSFLQHQKASPNTIRNYLSDVRDYLTWSNEKSL